MQACSGYYSHAARCDAWHGVASPGCTCCCCLQVCCAREHQSLPRPAGLHYCPRLQHQRRIGTANLPCTHPTHPLQLWAAARRNSARVGSPRRGGGGSRTDQRQPGPGSRQCGRCAAGRQLLAGAVVVLLGAREAALPLALRRQRRLAVGVAMLTHSCPPKQVPAVLDACSAWLLEHVFDAHPELVLRAALNLGLSSLGERIEQEFLRVRLRTPRYQYQAWACVALLCCVSTCLAVAATLPGACNTRLKAAGCRRPCMQVACVHACRPRLHLKSHARPAHPPRITSCTAGSVQHCCCASGRTTSGGSC